MKRIAIFPGTFDPPSKGHLNIIQRSLSLCDHLIVAIGHKPDKKHLFTIDERISMFKLIAPNVEVISFHGLVVDLAKEKKASFLIRGLRAFSDFELEFQMALANRSLSGIETLFLTSDQNHIQISSTLIREIAHFGGQLSQFVPRELESLIYNKLNKEKL
jgi:pantetheine-phosphate adenylyltransferase